jgi:transposase
MAPWPRFQGASSGGKQAGSAVRCAVVAGADARAISRSSAATPTEAIRVELKRGALGVNVIWPISAAADCAGWLRELLK